MYGTVEDVKKEVGITLLKLMERHYGSGLDDVLEHHLKTASAIVDTYVEKRFPTHYVSALTISSAARIAVWLAAGPFDEREGLVQDRYDATIEVLKNWAKDPKSAEKIDPSNIKTQVASGSIDFGVNPQEWP
jgi:phage gp36-like protein